MTNQLIVLWVVCSAVAYFSVLWTRGKVDRRNGNGSQAKPEAPKLPWDETPLELPTQSRASDDWRSRSHWDEIIAGVVIITANLLATKLTYEWRLAQKTALFAEWHDPKRVAEHTAELWDAYLQAGMMATALGVTIGLWVKIWPRLKAAWDIAPEKTKKEINKSLNAWLKALVPALLGIGILIGIGSFAWAQIPWPVQWMMKWIIILGIPFAVARHLFFGGRGKGEGGVGTAVDLLEGVSNIFLGGALISKGAAAKKAAAVEDPDDKREKLERQVKEALEQKDSDDRLASDVEILVAAKEEEREQLAAEKDTAREELAKLDRLLAGEVSVSQAVTDAEINLEGATEEERSALELVGKAITDDEKRKAGSSLAAARTKIRTANQRLVTTRAKAGEIERAKLERPNTAQAFRATETATNLDYKRLASRASDLRKRAEKSDDEWRRLKRELGKL